MPLSLATSIELTGFDTLLDRFDGARKLALSRLADFANELMAKPTATWDENVEFRKVVREFDAVAGTDNKQYKDVNDGFEHKTAFTADFRPKTKVNILRAFKGAGQAFPNRRREPTEAEARKFNFAAANRMERSPITRQILRSAYIKGLSI